MPAHDYAYNGSTIRLPFAEGDRVAMTAHPRKNAEAKPRPAPDGPAGQVVTVNHDNLDDVRFLVAFDEPVGSYHRGDGVERPVRNDWVPINRLVLLQANVDWAAAELRRLAAGPATQATVERMRALRERYDRWMPPPADPETAAQLDAQVDSLLAGLPD